MPAEKAKSRPEVPKPTLVGVPPKKDNPPTFPPEMTVQRPRTKRPVPRPDPAVDGGGTGTEEQESPASSLLDRCWAEIEALVRKWCGKGLTAV